MVFGKISESTPPYPDFAPIRMVEVEISQPLPSLSEDDPTTGQRYTEIMSLVRLHDRPLGLIRLECGDEGITPDDYARHIWDALSTEIIEHLQHDGIDAVTALDAAGIPAHETPRCHQEREKLLADAPPVSVMISTCNRVDTLGPCLDSLLNLEYPHYDIIVVDNAPASGTTAAFVSEHYGHLPNVRYVAETRPGLAQAHNRGLEEVNAPFVAITDDDVLVDKHWLTEIVSAFQLSEDVACVTGLVLPLELQTPAQIWIEQFGGFSKGFKRRMFDMAHNRDQSPLYPFTAGVFGSGANMAFRTASLRKMGNFDAALGAGSKAMGGDDLSAFFQTVISGYKLVYAPTAIIRHRHHREYARLRRQAYGYGVGLSAFLIKSLIDHPSLLVTFMRKVPRGLIYLLSPSSGKNEGKKAGYPRELTTQERKGLLYGPLAYLRSRWHTRNWH